MICYSIHTEHSSEFSINNDSIETEFVHVESNETLSTSKLSNNKKKNQKGEKIQHYKKTRETSNSS